MAGFCSAHRGYGHSCDICRDAICHQPNSDQLLEGARLYKEAIAKYPNDPSGFVHWLYGAGEAAEGDYLKAFLEFTGEWKE